MFDCEVENLEFNYQISLRVIRYKLSFRDCLNSILDHFLIMPAAGEWSDYTQWSECSADCGGGFQSRTRVCITQGNNGTCTAPGP